MKLPTAPPAKPAIIASKSGTQSGMIAHDDQLDQSH
jgi:hypothetical protein